MLRYLTLIFYGVFGIGCIYAFLLIFCFSTFKIPSDSMEPQLQTGDQVLVNKWIAGPRLFNIFASMKGKRVDIYRVPGVGQIKRNDILVFNYPHPYSWERIEMHIMPVSYTHLTLPTTSRRQRQMCIRDSHAILYQTLPRVTGRLHPDRTGILPKQPYKRAFGECGKSSELIQTKSGSDAGRCLPLFPF